MEVQVIAVFFQADGYLAVWAVILDGIGNQIDQDLFESGAVGHGGQSSWFRGLKAQRDLVLVSQWLHQRDDFVYQGDQLHRFIGQRKTSGFDPGQIENLIDQIQQMVPGPDDFSDILSLRFGKGFLGIEFHQLRKA